MKILMVNKFLHPNGGSETYIFSLGACLEEMGHQVQYFGMEHPGRCVGNRMEAYTANMDFHGGSVLSKLSYPLKTVYSPEARRKIRLVLDDFAPDVVHLNNFNYQLTPSVILEIKKWSRQSGKDCRIIFTAHDYQLVCPNHMMKNPNSRRNCERCLGGKFINCTRGRCIHGSFAKSITGTVEACFWNRSGAYRHIDTVVCCSHFMKTRMDTNPLFRDKTVVLHNFIRRAEKKQTPKKDYVLYFGRFSEEKGIGTLLRVCRSLPHIPFVFAGTGPLDPQIREVPNIQNVGFQTGEALETLIREAKFTVCPSEWYENCPFSVMESQMYGTPVLGADIGGVPELIQPGKTGELFASGDEAQLREKIRLLYEDPDRISRYAANCQQVRFHTPEEYCRRLMKLYEAGGK